MIIKLAEAANEFIGERAAKKNVLLPEGQPPTYEDIMAHHEKKHLEGFRELRTQRIALGTLCLTLLSM